MAKPKQNTRNVAQSKQSRSAYKPKLAVSDFKYGKIDYLEPQAIPRGAASDSLNWVTLGTKIEVRHGYALLGATRQAGSGHITGTFSAHQWNGTEVVYRTRGKKLEYLSTAVTPNDWTEVGSDLLGSVADGEDISFAEYFTPAGAQLWISSQNSDLIKIMTANPASYSLMYAAGTNFKGYIQIKQNRMFLWNYNNVGAITNVKGTSSHNVLQLSYIDTQTYTAVTNEVLGSGDGSTKTFTGTLAFKSGHITRTCFAVSITDGTETFTDGYGGILTGSLGGSGTINYTSGAYSVTFNTAPAAVSSNILGTYQWEDSNIHGISDFTRDATRLAGQGASFLQNEGGDLLNIYSYNNVEYCIHERKSYAVTIAADDRTATNLIYRDHLGMPNWRAGVATADGVFYVDNTDQSHQYFAVLEINNINQQVLPRDISSSRLDLSGYLFDKSVAIQWNRYICFAARTTDSVQNNRLFLYNQTFDLWDVVDFYCSTLTINNGALVGGDSSTNNVFILFSGFDDDGALCSAYWQGNIDDYGINGLKKTKQLWLEGEIQTDQAYDVYISTDRGVFNKVGTISGNGAYVDSGSSVTVGVVTIGQQVVGGGNTGVVTANHYLTNIKLGLGKFKDIQIKLVLTGIGYASVSMINHFDIRAKEDKLPAQYRS